MSDDIYRIPVYEALAPLLQPIRFYRPAEISGSTLVLEFGFKGVRRLERPDFDLMHGGSWSKHRGEFDLVFGDWVLEHVPSPRTAIDAIWEITEPGGMAVLTTCFLFPIHGSQYDDDREDFYRFSEKALQQLFQKWDDVRTGAWGNELAVRSVLHWRHNNRDAALGRAIEARGNDPDMPVITWVVARRPA